MAVARIKLNGVDYTNDCEGLDSLTNTLRPFGSIDSSGRNYTSELKFRGDAFALLRGVLFGANSSRASAVNVELTPSCCGEVLKGVIRADSVDYCLDACEITAAVFQDDDDARASSCFSKTIVSQNDPVPSFPSGFMNYFHPRFNYCVDVRPFSLQIVMLYIGQILNVIFYTAVIPIVALLTPIVATVYAICQLIDVLTPGNINCQQLSPVELYDELFDFFEELNNRLIQCARKHPSPLLRDYIKNACEKCGLDFKSDILNNPSSPYYNTAYFSPFYTKGTTQDYPNDPLVENNVCNLSGAALLDQVKPVYNAEWQIKDGTVIFERKDYFVNGTVWIDLDQRSDDLEQQPCIAYKKDPLPAALDIRFSADGVDIAANETKALYSDIISWDNGSGRQNGIKDVAFQFGMLRARNDGQDDDLYDFLGSFNIGGIPTILSALADSSNYIIMPQNTCFLPKLIITTGTKENARVQRGYSTIRTGYPTWATVSTIPAIPNSPNASAEPLPPAANRVNYPYYCWEGAPGTIYEEFHYIDDPRRSGLRGMFDVEFSLRYQCADLANFAFDKAVRLNFMGNSYLCRIDEATVNYATQTINVKCTL